MSDKNKTQNTPVAFLQSVTTASHDPDLPGYNLARAIGAMDN